MAQSTAAPVLSTKYHKMQSIYQMLKCCIIVCLFLHTVGSATSQTSNNLQWKTNKQHVVNGPIYTFLKTDKNANVKWGVRHYVPRTSKMLKHRA